MAVHSSNVKPCVVPLSGDNTKTEIDRVQALDFDVATNREKIQELGRDGAVGYRKNIPSISGTLRQLEYGSIAFWNSLANKSDNNTVIDLNDFKTARVDFLGYKTDDSDEFLGTVFYPELRTSGFSLTIGDPSANAERSFSFVGEDEILWQNNNKYVIFLKDASCSTTSHDIVIGSGAFSAYPAPVEDPDNTQSYIIRIIRIRGGVSTDLVEGVDFTYTSGTKTISFDLSGKPSASGDIYKVWYTAATYITAVDPFVVNDTDLASLPAENCSIYLAEGGYISRLQSVSVEVSFERNDLKEIGNSEVVTRGIKSKTVTVTLGRTLETYTIEEVLRGKVAASWGKIDPREFSDNLKLIVKMYDDKEKTNFLLGFSSNDLSATSLADSQAVDDYGTRSTTLTGENLIITNVEGSL
jgi:hypothetical protein